MGCGRDASIAGIHENCTLANEPTDAKMLATAVSVMPLSDRVKDADWLSSNGPGLVQCAEDEPECNRQERRAGHGDWMRETISMVRKCTIARYKNGHPAAG